MLSTSISLLVILFSIFIYNADRKKQLAEIDNHYMTLLDNYNSNLNTIKNYHKNHQALLIFDNKTSSIVRTLFQESNLKEKIYPFILDTKGKLIVHPFSEGANVSQTFWGAKILNETKSSSSFSFFSEEYKTTNKVYIQKNEDFNIYVGILGEENVVYDEFHTYKRFIFITTVSFLLFLSFIIFQITFRTLAPLKSFMTKISQLSKNDWDIDFSNKSSKEFEQISNELTKISHEVRANIEYATAISEGKAQNDFSANDNTMSEVLHKISKNISDAVTIEENRKIEDEKLNWFNKGIAKFGEVLRLNTNSIEELSDNIIQNIVKYVEANQGGVFVLNKQDSDSQYLELVSAFAFDNKKFLEKRINIGEGLVGTCAIEKKTIYIKQTPEEYIEITSGLGDANPRSILIVPVKLEEEILGVIELASFNFFEDHQIQFIEKIMESVASTLSSSRINQQTKELLSKFETQSKEMAEQEEEMRQNIEELTATQEEAAARESELSATIRALTDTVNYLEFDSEFRILNLNESFANVFDLQYEATFGKSLNDLILINKAKFTDSKNALELLQNGHDVNETHEYTINDTVLKINDTYKVIKNSNNDTLKIIRIASVID